MGRMPVLRLPLPPLPWRFCAPLPPRRTWASIQSQTSCARRQSPMRSQQLISVLTVTTSAWSTQGRGEWGTDKA